MSGEDDLVLEEQPDVHGLYWLGKILIALSQLSPEGRWSALRRAEVLVRAYEQENS